MVHNRYRYGAAVVLRWSISRYVWTMLLTPTESRQGWFKIYALAHLLYSREPLRMMDADVFPNVSQSCYHMVDLSYGLHNVFSLCLKATSQSKQIP